MRILTRFYPSSFELEDLPKFEVKAKLLEKIGFYRVLQWRIFQQGSNHTHLKFWLNIGDKLCLESSISQFLLRPCGDLVHFDVPISTYFFNPIGNNGSHETANAIWIFYIQGKHAWKGASNQLIRHPRITKKITLIASKLFNFLHESGHNFI